MSAHESPKAVVFALGGNLLIAIIKFLVSFITGSAAMLAEAIHSTADSFNQILLLIGNKRAKRTVTEMHSFGYSREIFFWSLIVAVLLFFIGALFSIYEGVEKVLHPEEITNIKWIFIVLGSSVIIEGKSFQVAYKEFRKGTKKRLFRAIRDSQNVNLIVVIMEDAAALTGLVIVLITTFLAWQVNPVFDAIGSISVGVLLLVISLLLIIEVKGLIIGESIPREERSQMKEVIRSYKQVKHINRVQTMVMGNNQYLVLLSLDLDDGLSVYQAEDLVEQIKVDIIAKVNGIENIYIEIKDSVRNQKI
ncbi:MAG: cation diffusion facilitator family transporter [Bacteroidetes bacterium]|nr:cation diffusion facilitator family transporter [Bacteroidota bacterium]